MKAVSNFMTMVASAIGKFVMTVVQAARNSFKLCLETIIPFLIFVSTVFTLITSTGVGNIIANALSGLATSPFGLVVMGLIITFPLLSPIIGPGAVIPQVIGGSHRRADQYRCSSADDGTAHSVYHSSALRRRLYSGRNVFV